MGWKILPGIAEKDLHVGCLNCSSARTKANMNMPIAVGLGVAMVTKDGDCFYDGESAYDNVVPKIVREIENIAAEDPDHDWRIVMHGPMHGETYQRQGPANWVCVESNDGFA